MKEPEKFPRALCGVMAVVAVLFATFGVLGYSAYGSDIQTVVLVNLPQDEKFVQGAQFLCKRSRCWTWRLTHTRLDCHSALHPAPALPSCAHHGDRSVLAQWQAQPTRQVAEEHLPRLYRLLLLPPLVGRLGRARQVCLFDRFICLVS